MNDLAGWLTPEERAALERKLLGYERGTGRQFAVLIVPSLEGDDIDGYAVRVFERWKLGKAGRDDGLLLLVAASERRVRIEVGYGLEGEITDALSAQIIRNVLAPAFRQNDFAAGIGTALDVLMRAAGGEAVEVPADGGGAGGGRRGGSALGWLVMMLVIFAVLRSRGAAGFLLGSMLGGGWTSRGGRGGFGGGGFGGGGGRSGGGGASGGW